MSRTMRGDWLFEQLRIHGSEGSTRHPGSKPDKRAAKAKRRAARKASKRGRA